MPMTWVQCPSCGNVGLEFDTEAEEQEFRKTYRSPSVYSAPLRYVSDWGGCNLCSNFVCQDCLKDFRGEPRDWCTKCDKETDDLPPLLPGHPDPRRRLDSVSLMLMGFSIKEASEIIENGYVACAERFGLDEEPDR